MNTSGESTQPVGSLEEAARQRGLLTPSEFADRVMSAVAVAPLPTPTRMFSAAMRAGAWREAFAALTVAWHLSTVRRWHVAPRVRARSFALVVAVTAVLGTGSLVAAAAIDQFVLERIERLSAPVPARSGIQERRLDGVPAVDPSGPTYDADESPRPVGGSGEGESDEGDDPIDGAEPDEADEVDEADDADEDETDAGDDRPDRDGEEGDDDSSSGDDEPDDDRDEEHPSDASDADDDSGDSDESDGTDGDDDPSTGADADDGGSPD